MTVAIGTAPFLFVEMDDIGIFEILKDCLFIMPLPLIGGGIKRCLCLTSVCRIHQA